MYLSRIRAKVNVSIPREGNNTCHAFEVDYCDYDATCKICDSIEGCARGTALLWNVASKELRQLPEFLTHERPEVRWAAKERMDRLCQSLNSRP